MTNLHEREHGLLPHGFLGSDQGRFDR